MAAVGPSIFHVFSLLSIKSSCEGTQALDAGNSFLGLPELKL